MKLKLTEDSLKALCCGEIIPKNSEIQFDWKFYSKNRVFIIYNAGYHKVKYSSLRRCSGYTV